ncbi:hypothetical protein [Rhodococcus sp. USK13]|uniref:hypothetical protein n=1 Tax=Rhodococcus sp. USK13 TaxID=2806442 RepID=UPI001BCEF2C1|nr:hypothetical protein [Rhodococcus sp. USK13]
MATALPGDVLTDRKVDYLRRLADRVPGHDRGAVLAPTLASKGRAHGGARRKRRRRRKLAAVA